NDREKLFPFALARQEIGDVMKRHDPGHDFAVRSMNGRSADLEITPVAGVGPRHEELALGRLSLHRPIHRVCTGRDGTAGHQLFDVDRVAKLSERLELRNTDDLLRTGIGFVAPGW